MKLTNLSHLPQPLYEAIAKKVYSKGDADYSITELIGPARKRVLTLKHWHELTEDALDRVWSLLGQVMHGVLERASDQGIKELRLFTEVLGFKVSGQIDYYEKGKVSDYKLTTVSQFKGSGVKREFEEQINCYAYLMRLHGYEVNELEIVGVLRDWSMFRVNEPDYPQKQVVVRSVPMWSQDQCKQFIEERVRIHQEAIRVLPRCTDEERWIAKREFRTLKPGAKRSTKNFDSRAEADEFCAKNKGLFVVEKPKSYNRCERYCPVAKFCTQYQENKNQVKIEETTTTST